MNGISAAVMLFYFYCIVFCIGLYVAVLVLLILHRINKLLFYKLQRYKSTHSHAKHGDKHKHQSKKP